ncbi:hypothetical protein ACJX0J_016824, partial [Zea mays]
MGGYGIFLFTCLLRQNIFGKTIYTKITKSVMTIGIFILEHYDLCPKHEALHEEPVVLHDCYCNIAYEVNVRQITNHFCPGDDCNDLHVDKFYIIFSFVFTFLYEKILNYSTQGMQIYDLYWTIFGLVLKFLIFLIFESVLHINMISWLKGIAAKAEPRHQSLHRWNAGSNKQQ